MFIPIDQLPYNQQPDFRYDTVIVGGGTVGLLIAKDLVDRGETVCILEAGTTVAGRPTGSFECGSIGKTHTGALQGRAIGLGGTSTLWGGQLARFTADDFRRSGHEWPLAFSDVEVYYDEVAKLLDHPYDRTATEYSRTLGLSRSALPRGPIELFYTSWLRQPNLAHFFENILKRASLHVASSCAVYGFEFQGARVTKARVWSDGRRFHVPAARFVLAAGTIGNIQIMLSAQRHCSTPWDRNPHVGAYFQDHLGAVAASVEVKDHQRFRRLFENGIAFGTKVQPKLRLYQPRIDRPSVCGYFGFRSSLSDNLADLKRLLRSFRSGLNYSEVRQLPASAFSLARVIGPIAWKYARERRVLALYDEGIDFHVQAEQWPVRQSAVVAAAGETRTNGLLDVAVDWRLDGRELGSVRDFVVQTGRLLEAEGIATVSERSWLFSPKNGLDATHDTYHQCGGLRMSASPSDGVTDPQCTVWGTDNLSVAGAAVFPTSGYANSTYTALALGLRLARCRIGTSK